MKVRSTWMSIGVATCIVAAAGSTSSVHAGGTTTNLRGDVHDEDTGFVGTVIYRERDRDGVLDRRLILRARNAEPDQLIQLFLDSGLAAAATADEDGRAITRARTPEFIIDPDDWIPLPYSFPRLFEGQGVRIGVLFTTLVREERGGDGDGGGEDPGGNGDDEDDGNGGGGSDVGRVDLESQLFSVTEQRGRITYRERTTELGLDRRFILRINDVEPGELVRFYLNGAFTAGATADEDGTALLRIRTPGFIDNPLKWDPMPITFPPLFAGDALVAGSLSGYMWDVDEEILELSRRVRVGAVFGAPGSLSGEASYLERRRRDNIERRFDLTISDGAPFATVPVSINGYPLGNVTLNAFGFAEVHLRTERYIEDSAIEDPIPDDFPSILPAFVITVGNQNGAFFRQQ
jgi:hypothetical protein